MPVIAVMYPSADGTTFDETYYLQSHMPLVHQRWDAMGLSGVTLMRGIPGPDGAPPAFTMTALLTFASMEQFDAAAAEHGKEIFADIPNFTTATPIVQFNDTLA